MKWILASLAGASVVVRWFAINALCDFHNLLDTVFAALSVLKQCCGSIRFACLYGRQTVGACCMPWDIHFFIGALALLGMDVSVWLKFSVVNSCISAKLRWLSPCSVVLLTNCYCRLVEFCAPCTPNRALCINHLRLMLGYTCLLSHSKLVGSSYKTLKSYSWCLVEPIAYMHRNLSRFEFIVVRYMRHTFSHLWIIPIALVFLMIFFSAWFIHDAGLSGVCLTAFSV